MKIFRPFQVLPELPRILFRRRMKFEFEFIPMEVRDLTPGKVANFFLAGLNQYLRPARPLGRPVIAQVEPANYCNLSCPLCYTVSESGARPKALLELETFERFIDDLGDHLLLIVLWNWGEPFLNPDLERMISLASRRGVLVHTSTNGNVRFSGQRAERIVRSGLTSLVFALDGVTQETYGKYRRGGHVERVKANIRAVLEARRRLGARRPTVTLRFVAMQHNEAELPLARSLARELGVDFFTVKSVVMTGEGGKGQDGSYVPSDRSYRMYEYEADGVTRKARPFECYRPWKRVTLDAHGNVIPCEFDYRSAYAFGSVGDGGTAHQAWRSSLGGRFRAGFNLGENDTYLCRDCIYRGRVAEDCTIERIGFSHGPT